MLDILVVDDEPSIRVPLGQALKARGHRVAVARDGAEAMSRLDDETFSLVVSDVKLPRVDGFSILRRVRRELPTTDVLLMTAFGTIPDAVVAIKEQAVDYVTKPFEMPEMLRMVDRIDERRRLVRELAEARAELDTRGASEMLIGRSPAMVAVREQIAAIADSTAAVLLTGESGTGKELVARMIHDSSPRRDKPFVAVNCAAIPPTLIEAELFGHERGAFTGAVRRRIGRLRAADGGTLFLDEIGEMPLELQPKLLRALEMGTFEPVGSEQSVSVDVRLISATNRDLGASVEKGIFRRDLYYRVRVFDVLLPPLRERMSDLPLLVSRFLSEFNQGDRTPTLSPHAWAALQHYRFPGNVRELRHAIQHATVLARGSEEINVPDLPSDIRGECREDQRSPLRPLALAMEQYEREYIERTLQVANGERSQAARILRISRKGLWKKMKKYGIE